MAPVAGADNVGPLCMRLCCRGACFLTTPAAAGCASWRRQPEEFRGHKLRKGRWQAVLLRVTAHAGGGRGRWAACGLASWIVACISWHAGRPAGRLTPALLAPSPTLGLCSGAGGPRQRHGEVAAGVPPHGVARRWGWHNVRLEVRDRSNGRLDREGGREAGGRQRAGIPATACGAHAAASCICRCSPAAGARGGAAPGPGRVCAVWQDGALAAGVLLHRAGRLPQGHAGGGAGWGLLGRAACSFAPAAAARCCSTCCRWCCFCTVGGPCRALLLLLLPPLLPPAALPVERRPRRFASWASPWLWTAARRWMAPACWLRWPARSASGRPRRAMRRWGSGR